MNTNQMEKTTVFLNHPLIAAFFDDLSITRQKEFKLMLEEEFEHIFDNSSNSYTITRNSFVQRFVSFINEHRELGLKLTDLYFFQADGDNESFICGLDDNFVFFPNMYMCVGFCYKTGDRKPMIMGILYDLDVSISNAEFSTPDIFAIKNIPLQIKFEF